MSQLKERKLSSGDTSLEISMDEEEEQPQMDEEIRKILEETTNNEIPSDDSDSDDEDQPEQHTTNPASAPEALSDSDDDLPQKVLPDAKPIDESQLSEFQQKIKGILRFRNYIPRDKQLFFCTLPPPPDVVTQVVNRFEKLSATTDDSDLLVLAPKKPNWDLKRDVQPKLNNLEKQTQTAILELIRQKLQSESNEEEMKD
eukprot:TRINITY_DN22605_c1_g1_i1.p1 TRINITY_DN22605_c1_g1~~TRINITY_DN22605_c1_g1_i1.p1  ORF type:complete len:200 (-),score=57.60 TRINITY_DN22605_c1_g1_i1:85-684(-)